jgi:hypothetical protein
MPEKKLTHNEINAEDKNGRGSIFLPDLFSDFLLLFVTFHNQKSIFGQL